MTDSATRGRTGATLRHLWASTRPFTFTGALVAAAIGTAAAEIVGGFAVDWLVFAGVAVGCVGAQALANLINDLIDYRTGVDRSDNFGRNNALVAGTVTPREMSALLLAIAAVCTVLALVLSQRAPLIPAIALGAIFCVEYTAPPLRLKHRRLGDVAVFLGFGAGMFLGAYAAQAGGWPSIAKLPLLGLYSLPAALLVTAIVYANNHRDRLSDRASGVRTVANGLAESASKRVLLTLLISPFALVALLVAARTAPFPVLLPLLALPCLVRPLHLLQKGELDTTLVTDVAHLHGIFGGLYALGILLA